MIVERFEKFQCLPVIVERLKRMAAVHQPVTQAVEAVAGGRRIFHRAGQVQGLPAVVAASFVVARGPQQAQIKQGLPGCRLIAGGLGCAQGRLVILSGLVEVSQGVKCLPPPPVEGRGRRLRQPAGGIDGPRKLLDRRMRSV